MPFFASVSGKITSGKSILRKLIYKAITSFTPSWSKIGVGGMGMAILPDGNSAKVFSAKYFNTTATIYSDTGSTITTVPNPGLQLTESGGFLKNKSEILWVNSNRMANPSPTTSVQRAHILTSSGTIRLTINSGIATNNNTAIDLTRWGMGPVSANRIVLVRFVSFDGNGYPSFRLIIYNSAGSVIYNQTLASSGWTSPAKLCAKILISNDRIWLGAVNTGYYGAERGEIFEYNLNGTYQRKFTAPVSASDKDGFGMQMAWDEDTGYYYVYYIQDNGSSWRGRVAIYDATGTYKSSFTVPDLNSVIYGPGTIGIDASGGYVILGAPPTSYVGFDWAHRGYAYLYKITNNGMTATLVNKFTSPITTSSSVFGDQVQIFHLSNGQQRIFIHCSTSSDNNIYYYK